MAFVAQTFPHAPQFVASRVRSVQIVPPPAPTQAVAGAAQVRAAQIPAEHRVPLGHMRAQAPQLPGSVVRSTQYVPLPVALGQLDWPWPHAVPAPPRRQVAFAQYWPAAQVCPQAPQSAAADMNDAQYVLPPAPGQSPPPPGQLVLVVAPPSGLAAVPASVPPTQTPFMQPAPFGHTLPHALQLRGSYMRLVQNGFCPAGSRQVVMPAPHVIVG
jgi:hypothetical protein